MFGMNDFLAFVTNMDDLPPNNGEIKHWGDRPCKQRSH